MNNKITVILITYNHKPYFRDAIESVLEQKTDFDFHINIFDDHSNDGTTDLVREYAEKYPEKITAYINDKNLGAIKNIYESLKTVDTPYYAFLETDDKWCDETKLQQQYDILENNLDCSFCGHNTILHYVKDNRNCELFHMPTQKIAFPQEYDPQLSIKVHSGTRLYRSAYLNLDKLNNPDVACWDSTSFWWFLSQGKLFYIDRVMSVYNYTESGIFSSVSEKKQRIMSVKNLLAINEELGFENENIFMNMVCQYYPSKQLEVLKKKYKKYKKLFSLLIYINIIMFLLLLGLIVKLF